MNDKVQKGKSSFRGFHSRWSSMQQGRRWILWAHSWMFFPLLRPTRGRSPGTDMCTWSLKASCYLSFFLFNLILYLLLFTLNEQRKYSQPQVLIVEVTIPISTSQISQCQQCCLHNGYAHLKIFFKNKMRTRRMTYLVVEEVCFELSQSVPVHIVEVQEVSNNRNDEACDHQSE